MEENDGAFLVVAESYCRYKAPARYDDELVVRTHVTELRRRSVRFGYEIIRAATGQIIAEGETGHVVTDRQGRVCSMPEVYRRLLSAPADEDIHTSQLPTRAGRVPDDTAP
jgi:acyl-CoA thioester hydrolase